MLCKLLKQQYVSVVLFFALYRVVLAFEFVQEIPQRLTIQMEVNEQYFSAMSVFKYIFTSFTKNEANADCL